MKKDRFCVLIRNVKIFFSTQVHIIHTDLKFVKQNDLYKKKNYLSYINRYTSNL